ncbi:hypothetical protein AJ78_07310 [Emergomyces pasteurianus Ep9510]|uniref:DNA-binding protein RAP1 n=1 Tax=Emergomyces pasteurianus Ep9510 TaxID=1447872 RepID=A0A1J9Q753_9EURO|nr:hypothetical protein AJ78_07310 [Emergomyces pasteurianus Ep9510]
MAGPVVYSSVSNPTEVPGSLFNDTKFWLSKTVPSRSWIIQQIQANGGKITLLEKDADVLLVDHMRGNNPPGSTSFQYIEKSIQNGKLESLEDHRAGPQPGYVRPVGSTTTRQKGHRSAFTAKDDQILYDWVKPFEEKGGRIGGNKIYQQLAEKYPHHTFQSWRDRYLKKVKSRPRPVAPERGRSSEAAVRERDGEARGEQDQPVDASRTRSLASSSKRYANFTEEEKEDLLTHAKDILNIEDDKEDEAWSVYAENTGKSVTEWKSFFQNVILPEYRLRKSKTISSRHTRPANRIETIDTSSASTKSPRRQRSESYSHTSVTSEKQQPPTAHAEQQTVGKRLRHAKSSPPTGIESSSAQGRKRKAVENIPRATTSPAATSRPPGEAKTSSPQPTNSRHSSIRETSTNSKLYSPSPSNYKTSASESFAISTTNSTSEVQFETAPQFQQDTLENQYQTPSQFLNRQGEFNGSPTPQPTPILPERADAAHSGNSPSSSSGDQPTIERMDEWIASRTTGRTAYSQQQVLEALACTTMDPDLADTVLNAMAAGKGIPDNVRGVWTKEDDERLEASDSRIIEAVLQKHGTELFNARFEYIMTRKEVMMQMEKGVG